MIEVYLLDVSRLLKKNIFDKYYQNLSAYRKEKIDRLNFIEDKNLSLGASILIDIFLSDKGYREKHLKYIENSNGKPYFENLQQYKFSISHSLNKVMVCFSDSEIGCDIQKIADVDLNIAKRFFTDNEFLFLDGFNKTIAQNYFYKIWTMKESFLKAIGTGINKPLNSFEVDCTKENFVLQFENENYYFYKINSYLGFESFVCSVSNQEIKVKRIDL